MALNSCPFNLRNRQVKTRNRSILTARKRSCGKVMFLQVSVHQSFCPPEGRGSHQEEGPDVTITHDSLGYGTYSSPGHQTWDLTPPLDTKHWTYSLPSPSTPPDTRHESYPLPPLTPFHSSLLLTSGSYHWRSVQTCSLEELPPPVLTSGGGHRNTYAWQAGSTHPTGMNSSWLTFLFEISFFVQKVACILILKLKRELSLSLK